MQQPTQALRPARWITPALLTFGGSAMALAWVLAALYLQRSCGWMAIAAALTCACMLRLGGMPRGVGRSLTTMLATLAIIVVVNWVVAATQIGSSMGLNPWDSSLKLGSAYAWTLASLANHPLDWLWMAGSLVVAALAAR